MRAPALRSRSSSSTALSGLVSGLAGRDTRNAVREHPGRRSLFASRSGKPGGTAPQRHADGPDRQPAGIWVIPRGVVAYTSACMWYRSRGKPVQTRRFRLDVWPPTGDAAKQGEPHTGVPLTSSAAFGYTGYLRCTLTSSVSALPLSAPLWGPFRRSYNRGAFGVRAVIVPRQVRKDPCWQHRAAPPPQILVPAACPSRALTSP